MKDEDDNTPTSQMEKQLCVSMETLRLRYSRPYQLVGIGHRSRILTYLCERVGERTHTFNPSMQQRFSDHMGWETHQYPTTRTRKLAENKCANLLKQSRRATASVLLHDSGRMSCTLAPVQVRCWLLQPHIWDLDTHESPFVTPAWGPQAFTTT